MLVLVLIRSWTGLLALGAGRRVAAAAGVDPLLHLVHGSVGE
jgi:hypothetical protein